jgi:hypothetical protein
MNYDQWITKCEQAHSDILIAIAQEDNEGFEAGMEIALREFSPDELKQFISEFEIQVRSNQEVIECAKEWLSKTLATPCK